MITFLKIVIKDNLENVGVWISPSKRGEKNQQPNTSLPTLSFFFFLILPSPS